MPRSWIAALLATLQAGPSLSQSPEAGPSPAVQRWQASIVGVELPPRPQAAPRWRPPVTAGSGLVVSDDGWVLTTADLVGPSDHLVVRDPHGVAHRAEILAVHRLHGLAVLKIAAGAVPAIGPVALADVPSDAPGGAPARADTARAGAAATIVWRTPQDASPGLRSVQGRFTSPAGGPGAAASPLLDIPLQREMVGAPLLQVDSGALLGLVTLAYSPVADPMPPVVAPVALWIELRDELRQHGRLRRSTIGVWPNTLPEAVARQRGAPQGKGVELIQVTPGGPAERAGLQVGDVVVRANGRDVPTGQGLDDIVGLSRPGTTVALQVLRAGATREVTVVTDERPPDPRP